jgi:hypothetical protein
MPARKQYFFDLSGLHAYKISQEEREQFVKKEQALRDFFLGHAITVRFTHQPMKVLRFSWRTLFGFEKALDANDPIFIELINSLQNDFIKKTITNERYQIKQPIGTFDHYFYHLSPNLKTRLNKETLIWYLDDKSSLRGFEDPSFYRDDELLGHVISHEQAVYINLDEREKMELEAKGVRFDSTS